MVVVDRCGVRVGGGRYAGRQHVDITRNGEPAAVLVSHAELEAMRETIAILTDAQAVEDIRQGDAEVAAGNTTKAEDLCEAMRARRAATK